MAFGYFAMSSGVWRCQDQNKIYRMLRLYLSVLCALSLLTTSCASQLPRSLGVHEFELGSKEGEQETWVSATGNSPGKLTIHTVQHENSEWKLRFLAHSSQHFNFPLQVVVSDRDCDSGYRVTIEYYPEERTAYREYIESSTTTLNEALELSVTWNSANRFTIDVNGESFSGSYYDSFSSFSIINSYGQQNIHLEYGDNQGDKKEI